MANIVISLWAWIVISRIVTRKTGDRLARLS